VKPALSNAEIQELLSNGTACRGSLNCPAGVTYFNNNAKTCQSCDAGCAKCDKKQCLEQCDDICGDCFGSSSNCIACTGDDILVKFSNGTATCRPKCDDGQFYDAENKECVDCMGDCAVCNSTTECLQCNDGLFYLAAAEENTCVKSCPNGYFVNDDGNCE